MSAIPELAHGTFGAYNHGRCRCGPCRAANTAVCLEQRTRRRARLAADPTLACHGVYTTYRNWGCRCDPCGDRQFRSAAAAASGERRWVMSAPTAARQPAVEQAMGWCPCCAEDDWCPEELAQARAEFEAAPELVVGIATYGWRWTP